MFDGVRHVEIKHFVTVSGNVCRFLIIVEKPSDGDRSVECIGKFER